MNRRDFLAAAGGAALTAAGAAAGFTFSREYAQGCICSPAAQQAFIRARRRPFFRQYPGVRGTGKRTQTLLWQYYEKVVGEPFEPVFQQIGDCAGQSGATAVDMLTAVQIALMKRPEIWRGRAASEPLYAGARVEVGNYKTPLDGAPIEFVVDFAQQYGVLLRQKYGDVDLTAYDPKLAKEWAKPGAGVPDALEPIAKQHPIKTATFLANFDEIADAVANGYPVVIGFHRLGFEFETDQEGFAVPTYRLTKYWSHAETIVGVDTISRRRGACLSNHWGTSWLKGPVHKLGVVPGGMWVDAHVIDYMLAHGKLQGTAIALSNYVGYPRRPLEYKLW